MAWLDLTTPTTSRCKRSLARSPLSQGLPATASCSGWTQPYLPAHGPAALADLNLHRDQISEALPCPLVIWTNDAAFTDLARSAPDFLAWRSGVFTLADPTTAVEAAYRQHLVDQFRSYLYSVTSDAPLAVDLERVFVRLTATQISRT